MTSFQHTAVVTEQGVADIMGWDAQAQARHLIEHAAHPSVRAELWEEARGSRARSDAGTPVPLDRGKARYPMLVADVMTSPALSVPLGAPLEDGDRASSGARGSAPLPGRRRRRSLSSGIVSEGDVLRDQLPRDPRAHLRAPLPTLARDRTVNDVMTADPRCVTPTTDSAEVAQLLARRGWKSLPVVDDEQHLVGVVSRSDILRGDGRARRRARRRRSTRALIEAGHAGSVIVERPVATSRVHPDVPELGPAAMAVAADRARHPQRAARALTARPAPGRSQGAAGPGAAPASVRQQLATRRSGRARMRTHTDVARVADRPRRRVEPGQLRDERRRRPRGRPCPETVTLHPVTVARSYSSTSKPTGSWSAAASIFEPPLVRK